ncbi:MAG: phosphatidylserine decarboxylase family protein [Cyclobacteriaceae bacterium]
MTIHKEGRSLLIILLVVLVALNVIVGGVFHAPEMIRLLMAVASVIIYLLVLQFFRSPRVNTPLNEKYVFAPADGKVVVIEQTTEEEYFQEVRQQISIFMSPLNVHVNRNPVSGIVKFFKYHAGEYLVAWHPKSSTANERTTVVIEMANGLDILMRQIAGAVARRIRCYIDTGDAVQQGDEFGFIKFGSRVDVFLPLDAKIRVQIGDHTKAGKTVLAELTGQ